MPDVAAPEARPPREIWYEAGGARLFALESGEPSGQAVVMLHGGMASHGAVLPLVQPLASRCRVLTPDLRGSGRSHAAEALTFDRLADDVAALLDHAGARRAIVGGVSAGSGIALRFALRHPQRLVAVLLVKPLYAGADRGYDEAQGQAFARMDALAQEAPAQGIAAVAPLYAELPVGIREKALAMLATFDPASLAATSRFLASGAQPFASVNELRSISVPALLIGGDDPMHPPGVSELYAQALERAEVFPASTPDPAAVIDAFCERLERPRPRDA